MTPPTGDAEDPCRRKKAPSLTSQTLHLITTCAKPCFKTCTIQTLSARDLSPIGSRGFTSQSWCTCLAELARQRRTLARHVAPSQAVPQAPLPPAHYTLKFTICLQIFQASCGMSTSVKTSPLRVSGGMDEGRSAEKAGMNGASESDGLSEFGYPVAACSRLLEVGAVLGRQSGLQHGARIAHVIGVADVGASARIPGLEVG